MTIEPIMLLRLREDCEQLDPVKIIEPIEVAGNLASCAAEHEVAEQLTTFRLCE